MPPLIHPTRPAATALESGRSSRAVASAHGRVRRTLERLGSIPGPGVVTGASDDDPSGVATYSVTGAQTGYQLLWSSVLTLPLNAGVQEMCARIGLVTGGGLASVLRRHYPRPILLSLVVSLLVANTINIGADIAAVAAGIDLISPVPERTALVPVGVAIAASEIVIPYRIFATYLKALTLVLLAYVVDGFVVHADWATALRDTLAPRFEFTAAFITTVVAVFGTTISPYLFFWQTSEEVEEMHERHIRAADPAAVRRARLDTNVGMLLAHVVFFFIVLTTAATLHPAGISEIRTAGEAAESLRPLAGDGAAALFAIGLIGTGLLAIPVLAASAAYAVAEVFDWREGLEREPRQAPQFYIVIGVSTLVGLLIALSGVGALRALFVAAVVNGVVAPILIAAIVVVSNDRRVMGGQTNGWLSNATGGAAAAIMGAAAVVMLVTLLARA